MKNSICLVLGFLFLVSCGGKSTKFYSAKEESFSKFVNEKAKPKYPNMTLDKSIINNDYPIQLALYKDGQFYYDLPNLDDGKGTWSYENGQIVLRSKHRLFDMKINVKALDQDATNVGITFFDRHGFQELKMEKINLE
jgi:hypothetical protein